MRKAWTLPLGYETKGNTIYLELCKVADWLRNFAESGVRERHRQVVVFSDAKSLLDTLQDQTAAANDLILGEIVRVVDTLISRGSGVIFQ